MIVRRNWALRLSVVFNICVLLYICVHFRSGTWIEDASNWENSSEASNDLQTNSNNQSSQITSRLLNSIEGRLLGKLISKGKNKPTESIEASKTIENKEQTSHKSETAQSSSLFLSGQEVSA